MDRHTNTTVRARPNNQEDRAAPRRSKRTRTEGDDSDEGSLGRVRHRVTRACNECRRRKDRCNGQRPFCASCVAGGRSCSYGPSKKRGLRTGYVRALEVLLSLVFATFEESEEWVCRLLQGHAERPNFRRRATEMHLSKNKTADALLETWRKGSVVKHIEQLLSRSEVADDEDEGSLSTKYFDVRVAEALMSFQAQDGGQALTDFPSGSLLSPVNTDATPGAPTCLNSDTTPVASQPSLTAHEAGSFSTSRSLSFPPDVCHDTQPETPPELILPTQWPYLLDLYFAATHCWFPIAQKHELLRTAYTLANPATTTTVPDSLSCGDSAFLHAVMTYTSYQASMIPRSQKPSSDLQDATKLFDALVQSPFFDDPSGYDLGHVRALLLLSLFNINQGLWVAAWAATGRALYTAACLGLLPRDSGATTELGGDSVRRTLMGCAVLETLIAARINTKPLLRPPDIASIGLLQIDSLEEWEPWQPKVQLGGDRTLNEPGPHLHKPGHVVSTFNRLVELVVIWNELLHNHKGCGPENGLLETFQRYRQKLGDLHGSPIHVDLPPQALSLHVASVALLEASAIQWVSYSAVCLERPASYWSDMLSLFRLLEERFSQTGRSSVPPITEVSIELLHRAIERHQRYLTGGVISELQCIKNLLLTLLETWRNDKPGSSDARAILGQTPPSVDEPRSLPSNSLQRAILGCNAPTAAVVGSIPMTEQDNHMLLDEPPPHPAPSLEHGYLQGPQPTITHPTFNPDVVLGPLPDLDDDGLFDSLATLDSADWLANPLEFMQHLGIIGNPSTDLGSLFDPAP